MDEMTKLLYDTKRLMMLRYPRFGSEIASASITYKSDLKHHTAATDGKNIYFDPEYLAKLSESDRLFLIAHELMHIKFAHAFRLEDKNGEKRDLDVWNEATDAIINANLERDGFTIKEGYVNRPEALNYSAEEFYQLLLDEKKAKESGQQNDDSKGRSDNQDSKENDNSKGKSENQDSKENDNSKGESDNQDNKENDNSKGESDNQDSKENDNSKGESDNQSSQPSNDMNEDKNRSVGDDHSLWEEAFEARKKGNQSKDNESTPRNEKEQSESDSKIKKIDERDEFSSNREERIAKARENLERMKNDVLYRSNFSESKNLGAVGESTEEFDWRLLLRREIEKTEIIWSQRRSIAENNYAYRLEENDIDDEAETEVMIDVSGSVDLDLVRAFLRMLKPILKESKLKVGCFNEKYWGMTEIRSTSDIDNFIIPEGARGDAAWTEDWDLAVRSFTKKREINKIVFTDGYPCPGTMPKDDLKNENVIWLVYGNEDFEPCCGKVIQITSQQLERFNSCKIDEGASKKTI